jgi:hypothetical protein
MDEKPLSKELFLKALKRLDELLGQREAPQQKVTLIAGGGGAMILAHKFPLATTDLDAIPKSISPTEIDPYVKQIAKEQGLPADWLNPYFSTFTHTLPQDYGDRLIEVWNSKNLSVLALGREDLLIMKCFAGRAKDIAHARALMKAGADVKFVSDHIETLKRKKIPGAEKALDFLDDLME